MHTLLSAVHPVWILLMAAALEALTCLLRFGLKMRSVRHTRGLAPFTGGWRIHHGYVGVVMAVAGTLWLSGPAPWRTWVLYAGVALLVSDLVHHFGVLWPLFGSPQFDLRYPEED